jgi:insertion element IS1 protein InsB
MFEVLIQVKCPHCEGTNIKRNGIKSSGQQNYCCKNCNKQFQSHYRYRGADPKVRKQALEMSMNGSGIRDIGRVLKLAPSSVLDKLRRTMSKVSEPNLTATVREIQIDEFWTFVGRRKEQKRWCWYAFDPDSGKILAFHIGKRSQSACRKLYEKIKHVDCEFICTDDYKAYQKVIPENKHVISKHFTTHIERRNRDFRTHLKRLARKTVCHSRSDTMLYLFIKQYIHLRNAA